MGDPRYIILLTGASGFIGKHILRILKDKGKVYLLRSSRLNSLKLSANIKVVSLYEIDCLEKITHIIHCAGVMKGNKRYFYKVNVGLTKELLNLNTGHRAHFIFISTLNIQLRFHTHYEKTKLIAERLVAKQNFPTTIIRPSYVFSQNSEPNLEILKKIVPLLKILKFFPILPYTCYLQPVDISELSDLIFKVVSTNEVTASIIEIAGPKKIEIWEMVLAFLRSQGCQVKIIYIPKIATLFLNLLSKSKIKCFFQDKTINRKAQEGIQKITGYSKQPFLRYYHKDSAPPI